MQSTTRASRYAESSCADSVQRWIAWALHDSVVSTPHPSSVLSVPGLRRTLLSPLAFSALFLRPAICSQVLDLSVLHTPPHFFLFRSPLYNLQRSTPFKSRALSFPRPHSIPFPSGVLSLSAFYPLPHSFSCRTLSRRHNASRRIVTHCLSLHAALSLSLSLYQSAARKRAERLRAMIMVLRSRTYI